MVCHSSLASENGLVTNRACTMSVRSSSCDANVPQQLLYLSRMQRKHIQVALGASEKHSHFKWSFACPSESAEHEASD